jgi:hypothetical protein
MCRPKDFLIFFPSQWDCWICWSKFPFLVILSELLVQCVIGSYLQHGSCTLLVHIIFLNFYFFHNFFFSDFSLITFHQLETPYYKKPWLYVAKKRN